MTERNNEPISEFFKDPRFHKFLSISMSIYNLIIILLSNFVLYSIFNSQHIAILDKSLNLVIATLLSILIIETKIISKLLSSISKLFQLFRKIFLNEGIISRIILETRKTKIAFMKTFSGIGFMLKNIKSISVNIFKNICKIKYNILFPAFLKDVIFDFLNKTFIILIIWFLIILFYIVFRYITLSNFNTNFFSLLTLFGIILAIFQFYFAQIKQRREQQFKQIKNKVDEIIMNEFKSNLDFMEYFNKPEYNTLGEIISKSQNKEITISKKTQKGNSKNEVKDNRKKTSINIDEDVMVIFSRMERHIKIYENPSNVNPLLNKFYDEYFQYKYNRIISKIEKEDVIDDELIIEYIFNSLLRENHHILKHIFLRKKDFDEGERNDLITFKERFEMLNHNLYLERVVNAFLK